MTFEGLSVLDLENYQGTSPEPDDFDARWADTLASSRAAGWEPTLERLDNGLPMVETYDVTYPGFGGDPIRGWFIRPVGLQGELPVVVEFHGYGGGRGLPHERLVWPVAGYCYFITDTRGQGGAWGTGGDTPDPHGSGPALPGSMTRGIESFDGYYYRRLITDCVRAVDVARGLAGVDASRVVITGASQGGGLTLAAAGLIPDLTAVMADVPFLCHIERGMEMSNSDPYNEVVRYLAVRRDVADDALRTLSYVDGLNHAKRATAPALLSVGLMDNICPASTVYATFREYGARLAASGAPVNKRLEVYPYNSHEGGAGFQQVKQLAFLRKVLGA